MKRILVPTDFSDCADKALDYAMHIAKKSAAEVILLHACDMIDNTFADNKAMIKEHNERITKDVNQKMQAIRQKIELTEKVHIIPRIFDGDITDSILQAAARYDVQLIVMGTTGATGWKNKLFGSNAAATIRKTTTPVLTVPFNYNTAPPEHILLALNNAIEDVKTTAPLFSLAKLFKANVKVVVFSAAREEAVEVMEHAKAINAIEGRLKNEFASVDIQSAHIGGHDLIDGLQEYITENKINLLAMVTHHRSTLQELLHKSMTRKMAYHTTVPLLALPVIVS